MSLLHFMNMQIKYERISTFTEHRVSAEPKPRERNHHDLPPENSYRDTLNTKKSQLDFKIGLTDVVRVIYYDISNCGHKMIKKAVWNREFRQHRDLQIRQIVNSKCFTWKFWSFCGHNLKYHKSDCYFLNSDFDFLLLLISRMVLHVMIFFVASLSKFRRGISKTNYTAIAENK